MKIRFQKWMKNLGQLKDNILYTQARRPWREEEAKIN